MTVKNSKEKQIGKENNFKERAVKIVRRERTTLTSIRTAKGR